MKNALIFAACGVITLVVVLAVSAGTRWFSNATTSVSVTKPKPGVECVLASTTNGVALDCNWEK